jgi:phosphopantetheinyl transferase (holo-ACP synthase)
LIVNRAFSQTELECYYAAGIRERLRTFFQIWARKEARLKARGLRMAQLSEESLNRLPVVDFAFGESYVGAVAMRTAELALTSGVLRPTVAHRARANARAIAA